MINDLVEEAIARAMEARRPLVPAAKQQSTGGSGVLVAIQMAAEMFIIKYGFAPNEVWLSDSQLTELREWFDNVPNKIYGLVVYSAFQTMPRVTDALKFEYYTPL